MEREETQRIAAIGAKPRVSTSYTTKPD